MTLAKLIQLLTPLDPTKVLIIGGFALAGLVIRKGLEIKFALRLGRRKRRDS